MPGPVRTRVPAITKAKAGCWTRWRAFAQVRQGSNIQLLPFPLVAVYGSDWRGA
jgi:hypothetical protein